MNQTDNIFLDQATPALPGPLISREIFELSLEILHVPLFVFTLLGIVTNIINIRVFYRQGVTSDSTTVAFVALSVSDLLGCVFMIPQPLCFYFETHLKSDDIFFRNCYTLTLMPSTYPHLILHKITCFVTVYMSVERAICVIFPFKVKRIIKVKNTIFIMVTIYVLIIVSYAPYAANVSILWMADPARNESLKAVNVITPLGIIFTTTNSLFHSLILTTSAMIVVFITTVVMVTRLKASMKWRQSVASTTATSTAGSSAQKHTRMARNVESVKVVTAITSVYLVCLLCTHIPSLASVAIPGMTVNGYNQLLNDVLYTLKFDFDAFNSSVPMFFFVRMSSKYRKTLLALWKRQ